MNALTRSAALCILSLCVGFEWPGQAARLTRELELSAPRERRDIIRLLAATTPREAEPAILKACKDSDSSVRREALRAAGRIGASHATSVLLGALSDPDASIRATAAEALGALGVTEAEQPLARALADSEALVRRAAVAALARLRSPGQLAALIGALDDVDVEVRVEAVHALASAPSERARDALLGKSRDAAPEVRAAALDAIASAQDPRASVALALALDDSADAVVLAAIRGLRSTHSLDQAELLRPLLRSPRSRVATAARLSLERANHEPGATEQPDEAPQVAAWIPWLERTVDAQADAVAIISGLEATLPEGEALALDPLLLYAPRVPRALAARLAGLLGRTHAPGAIAPLVKMLDDPTAEVRAAAALGLGKVGSAAQAARLIALLDDRAPNVRATAAHALGTLADGKSLGVLLDRADRAAQGTAAEPADTLTALADATRRLRSDLTPKQREQMLRVLVTELQTGQALPAVEAARGLGELGDAAAVAALAGLDAHARSGVRVAAARALLRTGQAAALPPLRALAHDGDLAVRATALAALGLAGDASDVGSVREALEHGRWPIGAVSAFALSTLVVRGQANSEMLCGLLAAQEPLTRIDAWVALRARPAAACEIGPSPLPDDPMEASAPPFTTWRALILPDGRRLISHPDAIGEIAFPGVISDKNESPWRMPYTRRQATE